MSCLLHTVHSAAHLRILQPAGVPDWQQMQLRRFHLEGDATDLGDAGVSPTTIVQKGLAPFRDMLSAMQKK
jgi:hypothetical protein